jgi:putative nucleotidyltransferase with HDIG domain
MLTAVTATPIRRLPVQPLIAQAVLARLSAAATATNGSRPPISSELGPWIELDPSLAAAVLQASNAPHLQHSGRVGNIRQALVILGSQAVEAIATGRVATLVMRADDAGSPPGFWARSVSAAVAARHIAKALGANAEDAYCAALMHHVGDLMLHRRNPSEAEQVRAEVAEGGESVVLDAERRVFGRTHVESATQMATEWLLPDRIVRAIQFHHAEPEALDGTITKAVWAGIRIGNTVARVGRVEMSNNAALRAIGLRDGADRLVADIETDLGNVIVGLEGAA